MKTVLTLFRFRRWVLAMTLGSAACGGSLVSDGGHGGGNSGGAATGGEYTASGGDSGGGAGAAGPGAGGENVAGGSGGLSGEGGMASGGTADELDGTGGAPVQDPIAIGHSCSTEGATGKSGCFPCTCTASVWVCNTSSPADSCHICACIGQYWDCSLVGAPNCLH